MYLRSQIPRILRIPEKGRRAECFVHTHYCSTISKTLGEVRKGSPQGLVQVLLIVWRKLVTNYPFSTPASSLVGGFVSYYLGLLKWYIKYTLR